MRGTPCPFRRPCIRGRFIPAHAGNTGSRGGALCGTSVHPRACGEHANDNKHKRQEGGSSPRMRGTRLNRDRAEKLDRFIPAHAGNTVRRPVSAERGPVHPRACGEHVSLGTPGRIKHGSSPRMRGTRSRKSPRCCAWAVHPRACGEHLLLYHDSFRGCGSSPRMRGTRRLRSADKQHRRFIPAHAGNTTCAPLLREPGPVHPRACGEHAHGTRRTANDVRFIPAHAGNTAGGRVHLGGFSVHPRACGEHLVARLRLSESIGSSPRMRGTRCRSPWHSDKPRFIPAHAGNTTRLHRHGPHTAVHPRACGEHYMAPPKFSSAPGSSPRMRGTPSPRAAATD